MNTRFDSKEKYASHFKFDPKFTKPFTLNELENFYLNSKNDFSQWTKDPSNDSIETAQNVMEARDYITNKEQEYNALVEVNPNSPELRNIASEVIDNSMLLHYANAFLQNCETYKQQELQKYKIDPSVANTLSYADVMQISNSVNNEIQNHQKTMRSMNDSKTINKFSEDMMKNYRSQHPQQREWENNPQQAAANYIALQMKKRMFESAVASRLQDLGPQNSYTGKSEQSRSTNQAAELTQRIQQLQEEYAYAEQSDSYKQQKQISQEISSLQEELAQLSIKNPAKEKPTVKGQASQFSFLNNNNNNSQKVDASTQKKIKELETQKTDLFKQIHEEENNNNFGKVNKKVISTLQNKISDIDVRIQEFKSPKGDSASPRMGKK